MEKPGVLKSRIKFLMLLPKPTSASASAVGLQNQNLFSPGKLFRSHHNNNKGFSGPITSVVYEEARNKSRDSGSSFRFDAKEPTSPKISCMGQIKNRKKNKKMMCRNSKMDSCNRDFQLCKQGIEQENRACVGNVFGRGKQGVARNAGKPSKLPDRAPSLSQMKRFASGRDKFSKFDYNKARVVPDEKSGHSSSDEEDQDQEEARIPFSAPILRGCHEFEPVEINLQPRKEINLWKRRTTAQQPKPLQLNSLVASH